MYFEAIEFKDGQRLLLIEACPWVSLCNEIE